MKLPSLREIELSSFKNKDVIKNSLLKEKTGNHPGLFVLPETFNVEQIGELLDLLEEIFNELNIHPLLPYPFYVITKKINHHHFFPILSHPSKITPYYSLRSNKLQASENTAMEKILLHLEKAKYSQITHKLFFVQESAKDKKQLYQLAHTNAFYEKIIASFSKVKNE